MAFNMTGKWVGQYTYGNEYPESLRGKSINFLMDCVDVNGVISGTVTDEETSHIFNEPGTFSGFVEDNFTSFIKLYPFHVSFDENENLSAVTEQPSHEIHYSGYLQDGAFSGDWEIHSEYFDEDGIRNSYVLTGIWSMKFSE